MAPTRTHMAITRCSHRASRRPVSEKDDDVARERTASLPDNIYDAVRLFQGRGLIKEASESDVALQVRREPARSAERLPQGPRLAHIKTAEIQFHHEVTNQYLLS